eukprot:Phypoly_transcript_02499.p1 GENE.Phypoly_transcript_02499~~Phypoly_transcript_02499.p1  ORF type:complete len:314 (-),score=38.89 Phypoly_transcript_02499:979-1920(-)
MEVKEKTTTTSIINGKTYALTVSNKPVCVKAFTSLYGCSHYKLSSATEDTTTTSATPSPKPIDTSSPGVMDGVQKELSTFFAQSTTPATYDGKEIHYLHGFQSRKQLWELFIDADIIFGSSLLKPAKGTFLAVWRNKFSNVWLAGETTCATCFRLETIITSNPIGSFERTQAEKEYKTHKQHAKEQNDFSIQMQDAARTRKLPILSIVTDYKGGDPVPACHPSTFEYSRFPCLVLHYSGFLIDNTNAPYYYIHTEHWTESANTVVTTLHKLLTSQSSLPPDLVLGVDGHSTNMNATLYAYHIFFKTLNKTKFD